MTEAHRFPRGMRTLQDLQERCVVDGKHWIWQGRVTSKRPACKINGEPIHGMRITAVLAGRAAERQSGQRWTSRCGMALCLSPTCLMLAKSQGDMLRVCSRSGRLQRGRSTRDAISRMHQRRGTSYPDWMVQWAKDSQQPSREAARALQVHDSTVRAWRSGRSHLRASSGMFSQLIAAEGTR